MLNINLEINAFTKAADEVGGDYYDIYKFSENKLEKKEKKIEKPWIIIW